MRDEEAFLHAIIQTPDDDTPRLVLADFLEEKETRAESSSASNASWPSCPRAAPGGNC